MPTPTSPSTTDFVQDYAAKRAAQMERARKLREERQHHLQQQVQQGPPFGNPGTSNVNNNNSSGSSAHRASRSSSNASPSSTPAVITASPNRRIVNLVEEDFKRATKAGIITPDQARQLWAMLSDQIVHVEHNATLPVSSMESSTAMPNGAELSVSPAGHSGQSASFRSSISMDSLRASIAQFKEQQKRQQFGSRPQANRAAGNVDNTSQEAYDVAARVFALAGANPVSGSSGTAMSRPARRELYGESSEKSAPHTYQQQIQQQKQLEDDEADEWGVHLGTSMQKGRREKSKPAWNYDVDVDYGDASHVIPEPSGPKSQLQQQQQAPKRQPAKRAACDAGALAPPQSRAGAHPVTASSQASHVEEPQAFSKSVRNVLKKKVPFVAEPAVGEPLDIDNMVVGGSGGAVIPDGQINEPLLPCGLCGRTFRASILPRHEKACQQVQKKRRAFDVKGQRMDGIEGIKEVQASSQPPSKKRQQPSLQQQQQPAGKLPKWKIQHEQFQAAMRAMKQVDNGGDNAMGNYAGGPLMSGGKRMPPPAPMPEAYDDRVPCPHCGRKFAEVAAERHIPMCAKTIAKPKGIRPTRR